MTREEKLMKVHALLAEVSDVLVDRFFDADSEELLDEKIEAENFSIYRFLHQNNCKI